MNGHEREGEVGRGRRNSFQAPRRADVDPNAHFFSILRAEVVPEDPHAALLHAEVVSNDVAVIASAYRGRFQRCCRDHFCAPNSFMRILLRRFCMPKSFPTMLPWSFLHAEVIFEALPNALLRAADFLGAPHSEPTFVFSCSQHPFSVTLRDETIRE